MLNNFKKWIPSIFKNFYHNFRNRNLIKNYEKNLRNKFEKHNYGQRFIIMGTPNFGNLGDHAIVEAEIEFLTKNFKNHYIIEISILEFYYCKEIVKSYIQESDIIFITGGGFLGTLWMVAEKMVREIISMFPKNNIIIMPQSIFFSEDEFEQLTETVNIYKEHDDITIFTRDRRSFDFASEHYPENNKINFVPDIVTYLNYSERTTNRKGFLFCLRADKEKVENNDVYELIEYVKKSKKPFSITDTVVNFKIEGPERRVHLSKKLEEFSNAELVITDRLHGMIFSLITGTPCIAFDNVSKKVSGVFEWFKDIGYIICITEDNEHLLSNPEELISLLINNSKKGYMMHKQIERAFKPLEETIEYSITEKE